MAKAKSPKQPRRNVRPLVSAEDQAMFMAALDGVAPLDGRDRIVVPPPPPSPIVRVTLPQTQKLVVDADGGRYVARAPGVSRAQADALKKARPDQTLDLHGDTVDKAVPKLHAFLESARRTGWRCVLVIHGKGLHNDAGLAPLRDAVISQLLGDASGYVHAFVTAQAADGGDGATLVEVRK